MESIIVPIYKRGDKTDCSNFGGILFLSNMYKILSRILGVKVNSICRGNYSGSNMFNPLKPKHRLLYLKTQSVPRCKHFSSRL